MADLVQIDAVHDNDEKAGTIRSPDADVRFDHPRRSYFWLGRPSEDAPSSDGAKAPSLRTDGAAALSAVPTDRRSGCAERRPYGLNVPFVSSPSPLPLPDVQEQR